VQRDYRLHLRLGFSLDYDALHAELLEGVLTITIPKKIGGDRGWRGRLARMFQGDAARTSRLQHPPVPQSHSQPERRSQTAVLPGVMTDQKDACGAASLAAVTAVGSSIRCQP